MAPLTKMSNDTSNPLLTALALAAGVFLCLVATESAGASNDCYLVRLGPSPLRFEPRPKVLAAGAGSPLLSTAKFGPAKNSRNPLANELSGTRDALLPDAQWLFSTMMAEAPKPGLVVDTAASLPAIESLANDPPTLAPQVWVDYFKHGNTNANGNASVMMPVPFTPPIATPGVQSRAIYQSP